jgi:hypothetical protein
VDDLGLNRIDFGNRTYNPTYGRFDKSDIFSDIFESFSPYTFVYNSPLINIDMYGDSTVPVNNLDWMKFNVNNDEILLNAVTITGTTDVGKKVAPALGFWEGMWEGMRKSSDGRIINRDGTQSAMFAPITGTIPDVGIGRVGTIYTAVKKGLPYIGKTFNILKRYSKSERLTLQVEQQIKNIAGNNKLIRAIEQKALEYKRSIGEVANKRNAFNPKNKDYQEYMQKAETWLSKNLPEWKKLID